MQHARMIASHITFGAPRPDYLSIKRMAAENERWKELFSPWRAQE